MFENLCTFKFINEFCGEGGNSVQNVSCFILSNALISRLLEAIKPCIS